jgi:hypothetical protein
MSELKPCPFCGGVAANAIKHGTTALDNFLREGARAGAPNRKAGE